jgi:hypothetical protein
LSGDPRHRLDGERVRGEDRRGGRGPEQTGAEAPGEQGDQQRHQRVQRDRHAVKAGRLEPKRSGGLERRPLRCIAEDRGRNRVGDRARGQQAADAFGQRVVGQLVAEQILRVVPVGEPVVEAPAVGDQRNEAWHQQNRRRPPASCTLAHRASIARWRARR